MFVHRLSFVRLLAIIRSSATANKSGIEMPSFRPLGAKQNSVQGSAERVRWKTDKKPMAVEKQLNKPVSALNIGCLFKEAMWFCRSPGTYREKPFGTTHPTKKYLFLCQRNTTTEQQKRAFQLALSHYLTNSWLSGEVFVKKQAWLQPVP